MGSRTICDGKGSHVLYITSTSKSRGKQACTEFLGFFVCLFLLLFSSSNLTTFELQRFLSGQAKCLWVWTTVFLFCFLCYEDIIIIIYPLITRVIGATQMILQPVSSIFPCSPLPSGTWQTAGLSIPWCLPTSSSVCLVFFPLSLCLARWFWPDLLNGRHDHTTAVCISLQWSGGLRAVGLPAGS